MGGLNDFWLRPGEEVMKFLGRGRKNSSAFSLGFTEWQSGKRGRCPWQKSWPTKSQTREDGESLLLGGGGWGGARAGAGGLLGTRALGICGASQGSNVPRRGHCIPGGRRGPAADSKSPVLLSVPESLTRDSSQRRGFLEFFRSSLKLRPARRWHQGCLLGSCTHSEGLPASVLVQVRIAPISLFLKLPWTSLVAQWLRICLPMQGTRVWALAQEDPTCHGATKPVRHNYWACALEPASHNYWAHAPRLLKPARLEPVLRNKRSHRNEKPAHRNEE